MISIRRKLMAWVRTGGRLPAEYQEVEYVERTSGSASINTGIKPSAGISIIGEFAVTMRNYINYFGCRDSDSLGFFASDPGGSSSRIAVGFWTNKGNVQTVLSGYQNYDWVQIQFSSTAGTVYLPASGYTYTRYFNAESYPDLPMFLFARNQAGNSTGSGFMRCRKFTVRQNGQKALDFVPCYRKSDDEPGMYDLVSGSFFTFVGTGVVTVGPDVN